jgi:murein DD-endopeptidase MepM/ murein hydrolase activator NlpD
MNSFAQDSEISALLKELKDLLGEPESFKQDISNNTFQSPIKGSWKNLGDFNVSMKRHHGGTGHFGVDMSISGGTPIYPMAPGTVTKVDSNDLGGNVIGIQHANNIWSYYAHLGTIKVQPGDKVNNNSVIGSVGNSGNAKSSWPHIHFGVKVNGTWVNPAQFFSIPKYDPEFAKNPNKFQSRWVTPEAQQEAKQFNILEHKRKKESVATPSQLSQIIKLADYFYKLTK